MTKEVKKVDKLYVAGFFTKGPNKGQKIAIQVRNTTLLNPVEPIFNNYPDLDIVFVGKNAKIVKKYIEKFVEL